MVIKIFTVILWHEITTTGRFPGNAKKIKAMRAKTTISDFRFEFAGYGHYKVTYTSPATGKRWTTTTNDMPLIDATKNAEEPKRKDLEELKRICKDGKVC